MRIALTNFTGGEVAPTLSARYDLSRYRNALQCFENFYPRLHGAAARRAGTRFIADLGGPAYLMPFSFSADVDQNYVLVFGEKTLRIASSDGVLADTVIETPYELVDVPMISNAQVGDVVYLAHSKYPLHKVTRSGTPPYTWAISKVALNTSLSAPAAPSVTFNGGGTGYTLRYKLVAVDDNGKESLASAAGEVNGKHPTDWVQGNSVTLGWTAVEGAKEYNVYREDAGYFGFIGVSTSTSFIDNNYQADISDTPREDWDPFKDGNHPGVVTFHQQRMVLAGTRNSPQAFYMSRVSDFENFRKSRPLQDDDPVEYLIASGSIDAITWAASFGDLLLGTSGSEYKASGDNGPITAKSIAITAQSYWGSTKLAPMIIGNSVMHVQRHGARVRDLFYSLEKDGYAGNDLSIMAPHLFDGHSLVQWAYQQTPGSNIWIVRDDGVLLCLTYMKEQDIWGWSRHITQGTFTSCVSLSGANEDQLFCVVRRRINGEDRTYLECMAQDWRPDLGIDEAFYVDAGITQRGEPVQEITGLEHLEGLSVSVLADGSPVEDGIVRGGKIAIPYLASVVHVGLGFSSSLSPMPLEGDLQTGSTLGRQRTYGRCSLRLHSTVGGKYGPDKDTLYDIPFIPNEWGKAVEPFSGDIDVIPGTGQSTSTSLWLVQDSPLPFSVAGVGIELDMGQN